MNSEKVLREIVMRHMEACMKEARDRHREIHCSLDAHPSGAAALVLHRLLTSCAWSMGSTLASNAGMLDGVNPMDAMGLVLDEVVASARQGLQSPGCGVLI